MQRPPSQRRAPGLVTVKYLGNLGNQLTQYCIGRIIATELGFDLRAEQIPGFPNARPVGEPSWEYGPEHGLQLVLGGHLLRPSLERLIADRTPRLIVQRGYFHRYHYLRPYKDVIRDTWLASEGPADPADPDELTISIRGGDIWRRGDRPVHGDYHALPFSLYAGIVEERDWSRITVVTEDADDPMAEKLAGVYGATIRSGTPLEDFESLRAGANIVLSVSSFAWWGAWLSRARRVYYPVAGLYDPERTRVQPVDNQHNFWVGDEPRYVQVRPAWLPELWDGSEELRARLLES